MDAARKRLFFQQLRLLLKSGLTLDRALGAAGQGASDLEAAAREMEARVREGSPLSAEMRKRPLFAAFEADVVEAGEKAGDILPALDRLVDLERQNAEFEGETGLSRAYLRLTLGFTIIVALGINILVVPLFRQMMGSFNFAVNAPPIHAPSGFGPLIVLVMILASALAVSFLPKGLRERLLLRMPVLGRITIAGNCIHYFSAAGALMASGLAASRAFAAAAEFIHLPGLRSSITSAAKSIEEGTAPATAFQRVPKFPEALLATLEAAQAQGDLEGGVSGIGPHALAISPISSSRLLSFALLGLIILLLAFTIVSLYLPVFSLTSSIGG